MVRQARTYFAGAVSGVTLIGLAIALFVVLVSAQVFHQWPIAALGFGHDDSAVAPAKSLGGGAPQTASTAKTQATTTPAPHPARPAPSPAPAPTPQVTHPRHHAQAQTATAEDVTRAAPVIEEAPAPTTVGQEPTSAGSTGSESSPSSSAPSSSNSTSSAPSSQSFRRLEQFGRRLAERLGIVELLRGIQLRRLVFIWWVFRQRLVLGRRTGHRTRRNRDQDPRERLRRRQ